MAATSGSPVSRGHQAFACDPCLRRKCFARRATRDGSFGAPRSLHLRRESVFDGRLRGSMLRARSRASASCCAGTTGAHPGGRLAAGRRSWSQRRTLDVVAGRNGPQPEVEQAAERLRKPEGGTKQGWIPRETWTLPVMPRRGRRTEAGRARPKGRAGGRRRHSEGEGRGRRMNPRRWPRGTITEAVVTEPWWVDGRCRREPMTGGLGDIEDSKVDPTPRETGDGRR
jgi:hypothetical protein